MKPGDGAKSFLKLWHVLFLAFVIRVSLPVVIVSINQDYTLFHSPDTSSYIELAHELISQKRFYRNGTPELFRTPGYPLLLISGVLLGNIELVAIILQILLSCFTIYLVFKISHHLFENSKAALLSALMYALDPISILYASKILSETLFTFLNSVFLYYLVVYFKRKSLQELIVAACALSASIYVRPANYFLPVVIGSILVIGLFGKNGKSTTQLKHAGVFILISCICIGLWQFRNYRETGFSGFSSVPEVSLYCYQAVAVLAAKQNVSFHEMKNKLCGNRDKYLGNHPGQRSEGRKEIYEHMRKEGSKIILKEPLTYFSLYIQGIIRTIIDPGITEYLILLKRYSRQGGLWVEILDHGFFRTISNFISTMPFFFVCLLVFSGIYLVLSLLGTAIALSRRNYLYSISFISLVCVLGYLLIISGGPVGYHRFRVPMMPLLSVLSGYGLHLMLKQFTTHKN